MAVRQEDDAGFLALEASLQSLLVRAQALLDGITTFESLLCSTKNEVDIRVFKRGVGAEKRTLERLGVSLRSRRGEPGEGASEISRSTVNGYRRKVTGPSCVANRIESSNLSWYEALWAIARRQHGVTAILRRMYCSSQRGDGLKPRFESNNSLECRDGCEQPRKQNVMVDIIAQDGLEWIKVSTITQRRLLFEMAKEGWNGYDSESDLGSYAGSEGQSKGGHDSGGLRLVRLAHEMKIAARGVRVRYQHPKIRFILPNIKEGAIDEVDAVIADIRTTGAAVNCSGSGYINNADVDMSNLSIGDDDLRTMLPSTISSAPRLTSTLNIDCTILLSLISDISHVLKEDLLLAPAGRYCKDVLRQIEVDARSPLLSNELYPMMIDRELVCTTEAVRRMREIVETMGTHSEKMRAGIFFGEALSSTPDSDASGKDALLMAKPRSPAENIADQLRSLLRAYSAHTVPASLKLPIKVVDYDIDAVLTGSIPAKHMPVPIARNVINKKLRLSVVNKSMFSYGWDAGIVTLTGNRAATSQIERAINEALGEAENESDRNGERSGADAGAFSTQSGQLTGDAEQSASGRSDIRFGPDFCYSTPRSLIGKDKGKEGGIDHLNASRRAWEKWVAE